MNKKPKIQKLIPAIIDQSLFPLRNFFNISYKIFYKLEAWLIFRMGHANRYSQNSLKCCEFEYLGLYSMGPDSRPWRVHGQHFAEDREQGQGHGQAHQPLEEQWSGRRSSGGSHSTGNSVFPHFKLILIRRDFGHMTRLKKWLHLTPEIICSLITNSPKILNWQSPRKITRQSNWRHVYFSKSQW